MAIRTKRGTPTCPVLVFACLAVAAITFVGPTSGWAICTCGCLDEGCDPDNRDRFECSSHYMGCQRGGNCPCGSFCVESWQYCEYPECGGSPTTCDCGGSNSTCGQVCPNNSTPCGGAFYCRMSPGGEGCDAGPGRCDCGYVCVKPCTGTYACASDAAQGCNAAAVGGPCGCGDICKSAERPCGQLQECKCIASWSGTGLVNVKCGIYVGSPPIPVSRVCPNRCSLSGCPFAGKCPVDNTARRADCDCNCKGPVWAGVGDPLPNCVGWTGAGGSGGYGMQWPASQCQKAGPNTGCCGGCDKSHFTGLPRARHLNCRFRDAQGYIVVSNDCSNHCGGISDSTCNIIVSCSCTAAPNPCFTGAAPFGNCRVCLGAAHPTGFTTCTPARCVNSR